MREINVNQQNSANARISLNINTSEINNSKNELRIQTLREDIRYFRSMIEQVVHQQNEKMDSYTSILKSCDAVLSENYHKMHKKYLELLTEVQAHEAEMHLRTLESELDMLIKHQTAQNEIATSWFRLNSLVAA